MATILYFAVSLKWLPELHVILWLRPFLHWP